MAKIGLDLDGVLYDFGGALRRYLIEEHSWDPEWCPPPVRWEFYLDWGLSLPGFLGICNKAADERKLWNVCGLLGGTRVVVDLERLKEAGHSIHVITNRSFGSHLAISHAETAQWLHFFGIPYDTLTFCADKTIVQTDFMIEDNVENYLALEKSGCRPVLIDRPWNQSLDGAVRVPNIEYFVDLVLEECEASAA